MACRVGSKEAVLLLLAPKEGRETLHLLDSASSYSPLVTALMHGHRDIVTFLLGSSAAAEPGGGLGLEVDAKDAQGRAAIHYAAEGGNLDALKQLLEYRADINAKEITTGSTALHIASGCSSIPRSPSSAHRTDRECHVSCVSCDRAGYKDMVQFLLENKADVDAQDKSARTPVKVAHDFKRRDITDLLIQHGSKRPAELTTEMFKKAMKKYCDLC